MILAATDFPLFNILLTMFTFFALVLWLMLLFRVFADIFQNDMRGLSKAVWVIVVIVMPLLGVLIYLIARGDKMAARELDQVRAQDAAMREYIRSASGAGSSPAEELARLADLNKSGVIDDAEFARLKAQVIN